LRSGLLPPVGQADLSDNPPVELAPAAWNHRIVPNFSEWEAGDVVLVKGSWPISAAQLASLSAPNRAGRAFTHAGIYAGNGEIIDAMPSGGIAVRQVWSYAKARTLALRRLPSISDQERLDIVAAARRHVGRSYGWWAAVASKLIPPRLLVGRRALYCSTLVGEAVEDGCGLQLDALPMYRPLYPAALSQHQAFDEVELEWRPRA
jgi:uncharacterized protein YycO